MRTTRRQWLGCLTAVVGLILRGGAVNAAERPARFFLEPRDVVVFLGDSITERGRYIGYLEEYLLAYLPHYRARLINAGWGGDRVCFGAPEGGSPGALGRLERDVLSHRPTVVVAMLGLNDGRDAVRNPDVLPQFRDGLRRLVRRVRQSGARMVLLTTTPYDPTRRRDSYQHYNDSLTVFARVTREVGRAEGALVIDLHTPMTELLLRRQRENPSYSFIPDGRRLDAAGHLLVARLMLEAWRAPLPARRLVLGATDGRARAEGCAIRALRPGAAALTFDRRLTALPLALDDAARTSLRGDPVVEKLDEDLLVVRQLRAARYELRVDGRRVAALSRASLDAGVNLSRLPGAPDYAQAQSVSRLAQYHFYLRSNAWKHKKQQLALPSLPRPRTLRTRLGEALGRLTGQSPAPKPPPLPPLPADLPQRLERLEKACRAAAVPRWHRFALVALE